MVYILLIPFDVFATVRHLHKVFTIKHPFGTIDFEMYDLYFMSYILMIYLCFIGLPFSFFYAQSVQEEEDFSLDIASFP